MNEDDIENAAAPAADEGKAGYKRAPVKSRFPKGKSGNPFGRKKGQRNMATVLNEVLQQTVTVKQGDKSERLTKGEALIKVILTKANNGDRRAIDAVSYLAEKIGRIEDKNSETSQAGGVMLVPGVATSIEEWKTAVAKELKAREERDRLRKEDARTLRKFEAGWQAHIRELEGTPLGDFAVAQLAKLKNSDRYRTNYFLHWYPPEEEIAVDPPKGRTSCEACRGTGTNLPGRHLPRGTEYRAHPFRRREAKTATAIGAAPCLSPSQLQSLEFGTLVRAPSRRPAPAGRTAQRRAMG